MLNTIVLSEIKYNLKEE